MAAIASVKSPVMVLHEYCMKKKLKLDYIKEPMAKLKQIPEDDPLSGNGVDGQDNISKESGVCLVSVRTQLDAEESQLNEQLKLIEQDERELDRWIEHNDQKKEEIKDKNKNKRKNRLARPGKEFQFKVTVGDTVTAFGKGLTLKQAKQAAAAAAIEQLDINDKKSADDSASALNKDSNQISKFETLCDENPVGAVNQLTRRLQLPPVRYDFKCELVSVSTKSRQRVFYCTATIYNLKLKGSGTSKMKAKRLVASQLIPLLLEATPGDQMSAAPAATPGAESQACGGGDVTTEQGTLAEHAKLNLTAAAKRGASTGLVARQSDAQKADMERFSASLRRRMGTTLASILVIPLNRKGTNYCQMLQEIGEEQSFNVKYIELNDKTSQGGQQCLVELSGSTTIVCHGVGRSRDEAKALSAHNALQYLRFISQKPPAAST